MQDASDFIAYRPSGELAVEELRSTKAIRERCGQLLERAHSGQSAWFEVDLGALEHAACEVIQISKHRYHGLHIPMHSRWRHFAAGGVDRKAQLDRLMAGWSVQTRAHALIDLTVVSVLLDAETEHWKYVEPATGKTFTRAEGTAVASFHAFTSGMFSSDKDRPLQVDSMGLRALVTDHLAQAFQVSESNPLAGLQERAILLRRLGEIMSEEPEVFGEDGRPGGLFDMLISPLGPAAPHTADLQAHDLLEQLLVSLSGLWPNGNQIGGVPLGDCWRHAAVRAEGPSGGWVPLHRLPQWLAYSLLEPFHWSGVTLLGIDRLAGLADGDNGGLLIDTGVLRLRDPRTATRLWHPGDEIIVEWRALTVSLLDELAVKVRSLLHADEAHLPLACVLEGGTGAAGRALSEQKHDGLPLLRVVGSDGAVF